MPDTPFSIVTTPSTRGDVRMALLVGVTMFVAFALSLPFAAQQMARIGSFVPTVQAIIFVTDLATAVLLFGQFVIVASRALLILASGYLFSALIVVSHALSFPGAFAPDGAFGVGLQATPWLYTFWHFGFSAAVLAYACINRWGRAHDAILVSPVAGAWLTIATVVVLVSALTWALVAYEPFLPPLLRDPVNFTPAANYVTWASLATSLLAFVFLAARRTSVLELWVSVAIFATVLEQAIVSLLIVSRFSVGFYAGRVLSVVASTVVLIALLSETVILYGRLARYIGHLQRERTSKLLNVQAAVGALTHQLRQPLTGIGTKASAARRFLSGMQPDIDRARRIQDDIVYATLHTNEAIESIRALFKDGDQPQSLVDMNEVISDCLLTLKQELDEQMIAVSIDLDGSLPAVAGHRGQLREVILNLMQNAIEAMDGSANEARNLRLETNRLDDEVTICVQDTGPGIEQQSTTKIFDAFITTKEKGTGLGLAVSRMIVELHGGRIFARSDSGSGARFEIAFPIRLRPETVRWDNLMPRETGASA